MTSDDFEALYGPCALYSDHKRGEKVAYIASETGRRCTGTILWVCSPGQVVEHGHHHPVRYIVLQDEPAGFPDVVYPGEILES